MSLLRFLSQFNPLRPKFNLERLVKAKINDGHRYYSLDGSMCAWGAALHSASSINIRSFDEGEKRNIDAAYFRNRIKRFDPSLARMLDAQEYELRFREKSPELAKKEITSYLTENGYISSDQLSPSNPTNFANKPEQEVKSVR